VDSSSKCAFDKQQSKQHSPDGEIDKVCVHQDMVGRPKLLVVLKEQGRICLLDMPGLLFFLFLDSLFGLGFFQILSHSGVLVGDHLFHDGEFSCLLCLAHDGKRTSILCSLWPKLSEDRSKTKYSFNGVLMDWTLWTVLRLAEKTVAYAQETMEKLAPEGSALVVGVRKCWISSIGVTSSTYFRRSTESKRNDETSRESKNSTKYFEVMESWSVDGRQINTKDRNNRSHCYGTQEFQIPSSMTEPKHRNMPACLFLPPPE
jgi:hypothetical protein